MESYEKFVRSILVFCLCVLATAPVAIGNEISMKESRGTTRKPGEFRLPIINTPADVEALSHLNKEEKALGLENLKKVPHTDGWFILGSDPDIQAFWQIMERNLTSLLYPDFQGIPFGPMNLITLEVARHSGNDYLIGLLRQCTAVAIGDSKMPFGAYTKLSLLEYPDSAVWNNEERMTLKFTRACLENAMTDELFEQALETWGEKKLLRLISWLAFVNQWAILENVLDMKFVPETMSLPSGSMSPKTVEKITSNLKNTKMKMREFWSSLVVFKE
ncbi:MAG: hypothetical protein KJP07_00075 [Desulfatitalea sp.]|nr:hypothetical protein [Desulfatitalea sp.]